MPKERLAVGSQNLHTHTQAQVATGLRAPLPAPSLMGQAGSGGVRPDCWSKLDLAGSGGAKAATVVFSWQLCSRALLGILLLWCSINY